MAISVSPRAGVGSRLREAREDRGVSLDDAARETRIKPRFLEALEQDAPPSAFRAPVYARAFLREYARFLGLDPDPLVERYSGAHSIPDLAPIRLPAPVRSRRRLRVVQAVVAISVAGLVSTLAVLAARTGGVEDPGTGGLAGARPPAVPPGEREVVLELRVKGARTWLWVTADGERVVRGRRAPGFRRTFRADRRIRVEIADGGAVRLRLNGEQLGAPAKDGVTYRATFALKDGRIAVIDGA